MDESLNRPVAIPDGFVCDGCTVVPDFDIGYCCNTHDYIYRKGVWKGTRASADALLRRMIIRHGVLVRRPKRYWVLAWVYWAGVRLLAYHAWQAKDPEVRPLLASQVISQ